MATTGRNSLVGATMATPAPKILPHLDFNKINMLRVNHNTYGTGAKLRDDLLSQGGVAKFFRTKR